MDVGTPPKALLGPGAVAVGLEGALYRAGLVKAGVMPEGDGPEAGAVGCGYANGLPGRDATGATEGPYATGATEGPYAAGLGLL